MIRRGYIPGRAVRRERLSALVDVVVTDQVSSIGLPPLGRGNGGVNWDEIRPLVVTAFGAVPDVDVQLFEQVCPN